jgi:hypothetical protein
VTVEEARAWLDRYWEQKDVFCPCCDQQVYLYPRKLNVNMAIFLRTLVRKSAAQGGAWVRYDQCRYKGRDYAYLKDWGLAITNREEAERRKKSHTGDWLPTQRGIDFVNNRITVPSHMWFYNKQCYGVTRDAKQVSIQEALGEHFDLTEMQHAGQPN